MYETDDQVEELQALIDRSFERAGEHLLAIMTPERRLTARQVVTLLQGTKHVAFGTVDSRGRPFVSPLDGLFLWGRFYVGTDGGSVRARHMGRQPAVSLSQFSGDEYAVVVHGDAVIIEKGEPEAERVDEVWRGIYGLSAFDLGEHVIFVRVEPRRMFTYAFDSSKFGGT